MKHFYRVVLWAVPALLLAASLTLNYWQWQNSNAGVTVKTVAADAGNKTMAGADKLARFFVKEVSYRSWYDPGMLVEFSRDLLAGARGTVSVSPRLEESTLTQDSSDTWLLKGNFTPGVLYTVRINAGVGAADGGRLERDAVFNVKVPDLSPRAEFMTKGAYFALKRGDRELPVKLVNVDKLTVRVLKSFRNNLNAFALNSFSSDDLKAEVAVKEYKFESVKNVPRVVMLKLDDLIADGCPGVYDLVLSVDGSGDSTRLIYSDLGVQAAVDRTGRRIATGVIRLSDGAPVAGAKLEVRSRRNQLAAEGVTGPDGAALLEFTPGYNFVDDPPASLIASSGGDLTYLDLDHPLPSTGRAEDAVFRERRTDSPAALVFAERGVARPGETVVISAFARQSERSGLAALASAPVELALLDPDGNRIAAAKLVTDNAGFAENSFIIPSRGRAGMYQAVLTAPGAGTLGKCEFQVSDYQPDRIEVKIDAKRLPGAPGPSTAAAFAFEVEASYYFGAPLGRVPTRLTVSARRADPPVHFQGYAVGDTKAFESGRPFAVSNQKPGVAIAYHGFAAQGGKAGGSPVVLDVEGAVTEPGGRTVTGRRQEVVHPTTYYIGLKQGKSKISTTAAIDVAMLPSDPGTGNPSSYSGNLALELFRIDWEYQLVKSNDNGFERKWQEVRSAVAIQGSATVSGGRGSIELENLDAGRYELLATDGRGAMTRLGFWHSAGEGGERSADPAGLLFRTDRDTYQSGDTAKVKFASPGAGVYFVAAGGTGLDRAAQFKAVPGDNSFEIAIPRELSRSDYTVAVTLVTPADGVARSFGVLKLNIDQKTAHEVVPALSAPDAARSDVPVEVKITLRDRQGRPVGGAVRLYAVDEGILSLTGYAVPDIFNFFYGKFRSCFDNFDLYGKLFPELNREEKSRIGGDGKLKSAALATFDTGLPESASPAITVLPLVTVPTSGEAAVKLRLPEHTGALRLMAVASGPNFAGSTSRRIVVRDAASVLASVPGAVCDGDEFDLTFRIFNHTSGETRYEFGVAATGPVKLEFKHTDGLLAPESDTVVTLRGHATGAGNIAINWKLNLAGQAVKSGLVKLVSRPVNLPEKRVSYLAVPAGRSVAATVERGDWKSVTDCRYSIDPSPAAGVADALGWLNHYPYGCLEQTASAAFPFLAVDELVAAKLLTPEAAASARDKLSGTAIDLMTLQRSDGAFGMWPRASKAWEDGSCFAGLFLAEAAKKYQIAPGLGKLYNYLDRVADDGAAPRGRRAMAVLALATAGRQSFLGAARTLVNAGTVDFATLAAGTALVRGGYAAEGIDAVGQALVQRVWLENNAPFEFSSEAARCGMALAWVMECLPSAPEAGALAARLRELLGKNGDGWSDTQSNAWAVAGLAAFAAHQTSGRVVGNLRCGGKKYSFDEKGGVFTGRTSAVVENLGSVPVYVRCEISGVPTDGKGGSGAHSFHIARRFLDASGNPVKKAKHGDLLTLELEITSAVSVDNVVIAALLPGGLEIEDGLFASRAAALPAELAADTGTLRPTGVEKRADRMAVFADFRPGQGRFRCHVRAVTRGVFALPGVTVQAMYRPEIAGVLSGNGNFEVK